MLQLKKSLFLKLLWEQAGDEGNKIVAACLGSGIMQGLAVFSVLQGLEQLSSDDGLQFHTFLAFLVCLTAFYFLFCPGCPARHNGMAHAHCRKAAWRFAA